MYRKCTFLRSPMVLTLAKSKSKRETTKSKSKALVFTSKRSEVQLRKEKTIAPKRIFFMCAKVAKTEELNKELSLLL